MWKHSVRNLFQRLPFSQTKNSRFFQTSALCSLAVLAYVAEKENMLALALDKDGTAKRIEVHSLQNWSGTHEVTTHNYFQPESQAQIESLVETHNHPGKKLRCIGSGLSPNAIGFCSGGMMNLALCDQIISVDKGKGQVTVQSGITIRELTRRLREYGLTLENFASIADQQIGGFTQVSAHGTGAKIPPADEQVVNLTVVTPALGRTEISRDSDPELFDFIRVGLGALGIVTQMTLQCVPAHKLVEKTEIMTKSQLRKQHAQLLRDNKHVRYMWIPFTENVVVVTSNLATGTEIASVPNPHAPAALRNLLLKAKPGLRVEEIQHLSFAALRDQLIAINPLNTPWIKQINAAEAEFWKLSEGIRINWSDQILGFDCGGQQWVNEVAFPIGHLDTLTGNDLDYTESILKIIEKEDIPAPAPIEQRWTSRSTSRMSPAFSPDPKTLFSWIGIIMYMPEEKSRKAITDSFFSYVDKCRHLQEGYDAMDHWAKLELPRKSTQDYQHKLAFLHKRMHAKYPVKQFNALRQKFDPHQIFTNDWLDTAIPRTE